MTFKYFVTAEQLFQMKAMTKGVKAPHKVTITRSRGTVTPESNVKFVVDERVVFLRAMDKLKVIKKTYA
jgi:hypothetical protein